MIVLFWWYHVMMHIQLEIKKSISTPSFKSLLSSLLAFQLYQISMSWNSDKLCHKSSSVSIVHLPLPSCAVLAWMQMSGDFTISCECQWSLPVFELCALICGVKLKCYWLIQLDGGLNKRDRGCQPSLGQKPWERSKGSEGTSPCLQRPGVWEREMQVIARGLFLICQNVW